MDALVARSVNVRDLLNGLFDGAMFAEHDRQGQAGLDGLFSFRATHCGHRNRLGSWSNTMNRISKWTARLSVGVVAAVMFTSSAFAAARDDLNSFTKGLKGLNATFTQQVFNEKGRLKESSSGRLALSAPRLFRWEYVKPYPQLIVADGRKVWVYDPDLQQATVKPQGPEEQNSPLAALMDPAKLDAQFVVKDAGAAEGMNWLSLAPRNSEAGFRTARLGFAQGTLSKMVIVDSLGQRTEIRFSGWKRNPAFARGTFSYTPAKGVDVIGEG